MKNLVVVFLLSIGVIAACSTETESPASTEPQTYTLNVEGFSCGFACPATIKKGLNQIEGVSAVEIDYEDERAYQICSVTAIGVSESAITEKIESLNNGQYKVVAHVEKNNSNSDEVETSSTEKDKEASIMDGVSFEVPSFFDLFTWIK